jgi:hypothetical protein
MDNSGPKKGCFFAGCNKTVLTHAIVTNWVGPKGKAVPKVILVCDGHMEHYETWGVVATPLLFPVSASNKAKSRKAYRPRMQGAK